MIDGHTKFRDKGEQNIVIFVEKLLHRDLWPHAKLDHGMGHAALLSCSVRGGVVVLVKIVTIDS